MFGEAAVLGVANACTPRARALGYRYIFRLYIYIYTYIFIGDRWIDIFRKIERERERERDRYISRAPRGRAP